jgi:predicted adenylyl cyclase CyaB
VPRNLEVKCRVASIASACDRALAIGARPAGILVQEDTYFVVPHGRLKLRCHEGGASELISYVRPDTPGDRWSSYEKIDVSGSPGLKRALVSSLGVMCVVNKKRHLFLTGNARIHIDEVERLGAFLEFEVTVEDHGIAQRTMEELRKAFNLEGEKGIGNSYSDLILQGESGST